MASAGMISLDTQAIESQQLRLANMTKSNNAGFMRIISALQKQVTAEKLLYLQAGSVRSKRRVILARRQDIIDKLMYEIDTMSMSYLEAFNLQIEFEAMRAHHYRCLTDFVQYTEERVAVQKEKALIRMIGFAKNVIDDINEEEAIPRNNKNHFILFMLQSCSIKLAGDGILPRNDHVVSLIEHLDSGPIDPIVLFNALQLLDMLCSQNWSHGKNSQIDEQRQIVHKLIKLIPYAFTFVRTWTEENYNKVALFIAQIFQTLKSVLDILQVLGSVSIGTLPLATAVRQSRDPTSNSSTVGAGTTWGSLTFNHTVSTASNDNSSTPSEHSVNYFSWSEVPSSSNTIPYSDEDLAGDVVLWLKTLQYAKLGYFQDNTSRDEEILNIFCSVETPVPGFSHENSSAGSPVIKTLQQFVMKDLSVRLGLGSSLVTHALKCSELLAHTLVNNQTKATERANALAAANAASESLMQDSSLASGMDIAPLQRSNSMQPMRRLSAIGAASMKYQQPSNKFTQSGEGGGGGSAGQGSPAILPSVPVFGTPAHAVINAALDLGVFSIARYSVRMGPHGCTAGIAFTHNRFLKAADYEVCAALHCAMLSFSLGLLEAKAFCILQYGYDLSIHRCNSYFFVLAWLQCTLAVTLLCIEKEIIPDDAHSKGMQEINMRLRKAENTPSSTLGSHTSGTMRGSFGDPNQFIGSMPQIMSTKVSSKQFLNATKEPLGVIPKLVKAISTVQKHFLLYPLGSEFVQRSNLIAHLTEAALRIMSIVAHLKHILSVVHIGLLITRLLTRDMFMKRMRVEEILEIPLNTLLIPVLDLKAAMELEMGRDKDSDDEREKQKLAEASIQDLTVKTPESGMASPEASLYENSIESPKSMPVTSLDGEGSYMSGTSFFSKGSDTETHGGGGSRGGGSRGGGSRSSRSVPLVPQYWKDWTANNLEKAFTDGDGYATGARMTFIGFLQHVGETHLQSNEVMEQLLLMVDHLIYKSQLCKFQLVDHGIPLVVHRIVSSQTDNLYMIALSEMCSENLELKI